MGFCSVRGKRGGLVGKGKGPWQRNAIIIIFIEIFLGGILIYNSSYYARLTQGTPFNI
jgi:hypothetical protein